MNIAKCYLLAGLGLITLTTSLLGAEADSQAQRIIETTGIQGGLIVHVGCDQGALTTALHRSDRYVVQGLDPDLDDIAAARKHIRSHKLSESVSVAHWPGGALPYIDNLVNLLVISKSTSVAEAEILRVLAPLGVACVEQPDESWRQTVKPWPKAIDEWTHYLHGPDNNALADDTMVGPPRHMQWRSGPIWGRHHHQEKAGNPTVKITVSAAGKIFSLLDRTKSSDMSIPAKWTVVAQDGFNGVRLWETPINTGEYRTGLQQVWRQLIADMNRVYTAYGKDRGVRALKAETGETLVEYPGTEGMVEMIKMPTTLLVVCRYKMIIALDPDSGKTRWTWKPKQDDEVEPLTLAADEDMVFAKTTTELVCLSEKEGQVQWSVALPGPKTKPKNSFKETVFYPGRLLVGNGVVMCAYGGDDPESLKDWNTTRPFLGNSAVGGHRKFSAYNGKLGFFSVKDGRRLWETTYIPHLQNGPGEAYIIDGELWLGPVFDKTYDLQTGKVKKLQPIADQLWTNGHHYRCYPGKATCNYIITGKRGIELIDMRGSNHSRNNWARGSCNVGILPCNGLIYAPPHSCGCYMEAKLWGYWAFAGKRTQSPNETIERREKGKAYDSLATLNLEVNDQDWWTWRGNNERGGSTSASVPGELKQAWKIDLGGRLSATTIAGGKVFVAQVDAHAVHALDMKTGKKLWSFTADGRVDSPPTIAGELVLFGSRDGYVYALRAADGKLGWRFLAAPERLGSMDRGQIESVWPVPGSVLVQDGIVYATAGRSSYLDGGIKIYGMNPKTGVVVYETSVTSEQVGAMKPPEDAENLYERDSQNWLDYKTRLAADKSDSFSMKGTTSDILCGDNDSIYLRTMRFDRKLTEQEPPRQHLFSTSGLLDDWEHNRSYWVLGTGQFKTSVAYPWIMQGSRAAHGVMLAFDDSSVWGVIRDNRKKGKYSCSIYAMPRLDPASPEASLPDIVGWGSKSKNRKFTWTQKMDIRPRAMLHVGDLLFIGGMPLAGDIDDNPGHIRMLACSDGKSNGQLSLESPPVWDGMAATEGRLFIACADGSVVCLSAK
jgi:outer membrane protein assembly factor BamB